MLYGNADILATIDSALFFFSSPRTQMPTCVDNKLFSFCADASLAAQIKHETATKRYNPERQFEC